MGLVGLAERQRVVPDGDRGGRWDNQIPHRMALRRLEDVKGTDNVALDIGFGRLERVAYPRLTGEMNDRLGRKSIDRGIESLTILKHRLDGAKAGILKQILVPATLELRIVIIGHAVIAADIEPFV